MEKRTMEGMLRASAGQYGDIPALVFGDRQMNYRELYDQVTALACTFAERGFRGKKIDLRPELSAEWILVFLALTAAGAVVVLHEPMLDISGYLPDISMTADAAELYAYPRGGSLAEHTDEDDTAVIIFTSGTSGRHKGVMLSHRNIISDALLGAEMIGADALKAGDRTIPVLPVFHMFGITASILAPLCIGLTVFVIPDMKYVIRSLAQIRPRILFLVPMIAKTLLSRVRLLLKNGMPREAIREQVLGGLPMIVSGGAALQPDLIDAFAELGVALLNGYGITECSPIVTTSTFGRNVPGSVGRVGQTSYAEVRIIDGRIHVSGDIVMQGYCGDEPSPFKTICGKRWFDTRDNGCISEDGDLFITGRSSSLIILDDGNNISPEEIEQLFEEYEAVGSVLVYEKHNTLCASVYPAQEICPEDAAGLVADIVEAVNHRLPPYKRVKRWSIRTQDFRRTSLKKIIRSEVNYDG